MAVKFGFTVKVIGPDGEPPIDVELPVTFEVAGPVVLGTTQVEFGFTVKNTTGGAVTFPSVTIEKSGAVADKLAAALMDNAMMIAAGDERQNKLLLSATSPFVTGDEVDVTVKGVSG